MLHILFSYLLVVVGSALLWLLFLPLASTLGLTYSTLLAIFTGAEKMNPLFILFNSLAQFGAMILVVQWRYRWVLNLNGFRKIFLIGIKYFLLAELIGLGYDFFIVKMGWSATGPGGQTWMTGSSGKELLMIIAGAAIINSVGEEIFFRGYAFSKLAERWSFIKAAIVSALFFSLLHGINIQTPILFIHGLIYAHALKQTQSVATPALAHILQNGATTFFQVFHVVLY